MKRKRVHTKDQIGRRSVPFDTGEIANAGLLGQLHDIDYNGFVVVEIEVEDKENTARYVQDAPD